MATILTKKSDTASAVPLAADLTNAAGGAELAVNATDKRLFSKTSGGTVVELGINPSSLTMPNGTANGVAYLNGSKVVTSGSALTFSGQQFAISSLGDQIKISNSVGNQLLTLSSNSAGSVFTSHDGTSFVPILWQSNTAEQMRLTSTGLGIGTSSVGSKLSINAASGENVITYSLAGSAKAYIGVSAGAGQIIDNSVANDYCVRSSGNILFSAGGQYEKLRLDSSGNLGLGVTPTNNTLGKTLQNGQAGAWTAETGTNRWWLGSNWYYNSGDKYINNGHATLYSQQNGTHTFFTAPSGTAGNAITFTQAMSLTADGNLLVGTTALNATSNYFSYDNGSGIVRTGHVSGAASGTAYSVFAYDGGAIGTITQNGTTAVAYNTSSDYRLKNITGPLTTSGAYIDSLNPVEGTWKADGSTFVGLIAHEVQEVSRTQVATGVKDGAEMQAMDYSNSELIANLIAEVKSLRQRVATLEAK